MSQGGEADPFELKRMMRQEAHEKAFEIQVQSQRMYEQEKYKQVQAGLKTSNENHKIKLTSMMQKMNIAVSQSISKARLSKMEAREDCMKKIRKESKRTLMEDIVNPSNPRYKETVKNLIIQVSNHIQLISNIFRV